MRRTRTLTFRLAAAGVALAAFAISACGSDSAKDDDTQAGSSSARAFPVTIEHRLGSTTIKKEPKRVVVIGLTEQDILLELGVVPVATTEWYGEQPYAVWPWATELLGDAKPEVLSQTDGLQFERIAALKPDLIIGTNSGLEKEDYEKLSALAPTVTNEPGGLPYFSSWQDQTVQVAKAVGKEAEGRALVAKVEKQYADAKAAHPEFAKLGATFSQGAPYEGLLYVYPAGLGTDFLSDLGFTMTPGLEKFAPEKGSQAEISAENVDLIDNDVIVFATENKGNFDELQRFSTIANLGAVKNGGAIYTDEILAGAIYFLTPLSLSYTLDKLLPQLELAAEGKAPKEFPRG
ncbi:iron complex transport system substrate-binding protein [Marmoricola sp. OAE513]|uniref:iron-siderophore ABC transporter substrate-binding protein n=1 Tax=Marmoricola sp. OAE513 TaxID=2817894 RepID=UPI001AE4905C